MGSCPRLHGGQTLCENDGRGRRPRGTPLQRCRGEGEESVIGGEIPRLGLAAFGMTFALSKPRKGMKMDSV